MVDYSQAEAPFRPRKRLFIGLLAGACVLMFILGVLLWWVPSVGLSSIHPILPLILAIVLASLGVVVFGGLALLVLTVLTGRDLLISERLRGLVIKYLFPAIIGLGRLLRLDRDTLQQSFIALNNQLVRAKKIRVDTTQVLILLPHCIQMFDCGIKITGDVSKCSRCGQCDISGLLDLSRERGIDIAVATGGTLARKIIVEKKPQLIVAVACERDLTAGIRDAYPLPVIGILNHRPHGPCINTHVVFEQVREAIDECVVS